MNILEKRKLVRKVLLTPRFMRLKQISMAVDHRLDRDRKEDRYSHSIEVANACEILNDSISSKVGFNIDHRNIAYIVGLFHDAGHTAFSHEGAVSLNSKISKLSKGKVHFDDNSNNYVVIEKNGLLDGVNKFDREYILASLAKHPDRLYPEQAHIKQYVVEKCLSEKNYFEKSFGVDFSLQTQTLQCQIMDIADENCYIVSDIIDSLNILSRYKLAEYFREELPSGLAESLISDLYKSKNNFVDAMQDLFFIFCDNFTLEKGVVVPIDSEIESIRQGLARLNRKYVINSKIVKDIRKKNAKIMDEVFSFFLFENKDTEMIPSTYYRKQYKHASTKEDRILVIRNMLGSLTDKGIKKLYKRIKG